MYRTFVYAERLSVPIPTRILLMQPKCCMDEEFMTGAFGLMPLASSSSSLLLLSVESSSFSFSF